MHERELRYSTIHILLATLSSDFLLLFPKAEVAALQEAPFLAFGQIIVCYGQILFSIGQIIGSYG